MEPLVHTERNKKKNYLSRIRTRIIFSQRYVTVRGISSFLRKIKYLKILYQETVSTGKFICQKKNII